MKNVNFNYPVQKIKNKYLKMDLVSDDYAAEKLTNKLLEKSGVDVDADQYSLVKAEVMEIIKTPRPHQNNIHIEGVYNESGFKKFNVYLK